LRGEHSASILKATRELLALMIRRNDIKPEDVASAIFPPPRIWMPIVSRLGCPAIRVVRRGAHGASTKSTFPGSLRRCIRILLHWNTEKTADQIVHVYIKEAAIFGRTAPKSPR